MHAVPSRGRAAPSHLISSRPVPSHPAPWGAPRERRSRTRTPARTRPAPRRSPNGRGELPCIFAYSYICMFAYLSAYLHIARDIRAGGRGAGSWALLRCPVRSCACAPHFCAVIISFKEKTALTYLLLNFVIFFLFFFSRRNLRAAGRRDVEEGFGGRRVPLAALRACSGR